MQINLINFREEGGIISYFFFLFLVVYKEIVRSHSRANSSRVYTHACKIHAEK